VVRTYNKLAEEVLILRPPGPLADLARAISVDVKPRCVQRDKCIAVIDSSIGRASKQAMRTCSPEL
jgi:hypothetical protein